MKRSDAAKTWSTVLSELAQVRVSVGWERPSWRVSWQDGPSREAFEVLRFVRSNSGMAVALAWLVRGSPESPAAARAMIADVEAFCADTGYPQTRFGAGTLAAAELLCRVGHGVVAEMGCAAGPGRAAGRAGGHARRRAGADRLGGDLPLAGRWPTGSAARAVRSAR